MDQSNRPPRDGSRQILSCACVTGVVIVYPESFRDAGKMDYSIDAIQGFRHARTTDQLTKDRLGERRQLPIRLSAQQTAHRFAAGAQPIHEMTPDKPGASGDQDHLHTALISEQVDVQPGTIAEAVAFADFHQPAGALINRFGIGPFGH